MLLCVDQEKNIKVFRLNKLESGSTKRERIGVVAKKDFAVGDDFNNLNAEDATELNNIISLYKQSCDLQKKAAAVFDICVMKRAMNVHQHLLPCRRCAKHADD